MATSYRVCDGNTPVDINVTLSTVGSCGNCNTWYANYYNNERCYQIYRLTLSQPSPTSFVVRVSIAFTTELNNVPYTSGYYIDEITVPAGVLTYDFTRECSSSIAGGAVNPLDGIPQQV